jgi:hypothetical protein
VDGSGEGNGEEVGEHRDGQQGATPGANVNEAGEPVREGGAGIAGDGHEPGSLDDDPAGSEGAVEAGEAGEGQAPDQDNTSPNSHTPPNPNPNPNPGSVPTSTPAAQVGVDVATITNPDTATAPAEARPNTQTDKADAAQYQPGTSLPPRASSTSTSTGKACKRSRVKKLAGEH